MLALCSTSRFQHYIRQFLRTILIGGQDNRTAARALAVDAVD